MTNIDIKFKYNGKQCKLSASIRKEKDEWVLTSMKKNDNVIFADGIKHMTVGMKKVFGDKEVRFDFEFEKDPVVYSRYVIWEGAIHTGIEELEVKVNTVERATRKFDIVTSIEQMLAAHDLPECRDVTLNQDGTVTIYIDGDWKHSHIYCDHLMNQRGWACIENKITHEDGTDWYASEHTYKRNH